MDQAGFSPLVGAPEAGRDRQKPDMPREEASRFREPLGRLDLSAPVPRVPGPVSILGQESPHQKTPPLAPDVRSQRVGKSWFSIRAAFDSAVMAATVLTVPGSPARVGRVEGLEIFIGNRAVGRDLTAGIDGPEAAPGGGPLPRSASGGLLGGGNHGRVGPVGPTSGRDVAGKKGP